MIDRSLSQTQIQNSNILTILKRYAFQNKLIFILFSAIILPLGRPFDTFSNPSKILQNIEIIGILIGSAFVIGIVAHFLYERKRFPLFQGRSKWVQERNIIFLSLVMLTIVMMVSASGNIIYAFVGFLAGMVLNLGFFYNPIMLPDNRRNRAVGIPTRLFQLMKYRELMTTWTWFNITTRYNKSILGVFWIVLLPLVTSLILAVVFSFLLVRGSSEEIPFVSFILVGLIHFTLFSESLTGGSRALSSKIRVIKQIYFLREILSIVWLLEKMLDFVVLFIVVMVINGFMGIFPHGGFIQLVILWFFHILMCLGIAFLLGTMSVFVADVPNFVQMFMRLLFYLTPIIYAVEDLPEQVQVIALLNPFSPMIINYRKVILYAETIDFYLLIYPAILSIALFYLGYSVLIMYEETFADYI